MKKNEMDELNNAINKELALLPVLEPYEVPLPKIGDIIYVWGGDENVGGQACVSEIDDSNLKTQKSHFVKVKQLPGHSMNWRILAKAQASLKQHWGDQIAYSSDDRQIIEGIAKRILL